MIVLNMSMICMFVFDCSDFEDFRGLESFKALDFACMELPIPKFHFACNG